MEVIAIGSQALMDGFALMGIRTLPDPDKTQVEHLLNELLRGKKRALIYLQHDFAADDIPSLKKLRQEGGDILIAEIPPLHQPDKRNSSLEALITRVMGPAVLEAANE